MSADPRQEFDPFLPALRGDRAPAMLTERDVAAHLQCSVRLLQDWRQNGTRPPHWSVVHGKLVRYPTALFLEWLDELARTSPVSTNSKVSVGDVADVPSADTDGLDEPVFRGGRRKKTRHPNFSSFLSEGFLQDEWLFVMRGERQRPVDFIASLDEERDDNAPVLWLCLGEYLSRLQHAAGAEGSDFEHRLLDVLPPASEDSDRRF